MRNAYILLFALQLLFSRFVSFRVSFIVFAVFSRLPTPTYRSISYRYGSLLSAVAMDLNIPTGFTVRPTHGNETGQTVLQLPPCALHAICMVRMWRTKH